MIRFQPISEVCRTYHFCIEPLSRVVQPPASWVITRSFELPRLNCLSIATIKLYVDSGIDHSSVTDLPAGQIDLDLNYSRPSRCLEKCHNQTFLPLSLLLPHSIHRPTSHLMTSMTALSRESCPRMPASSAKMTIFQCTLEVDQWRDF